MGIRYYAYAFDHGLRDRARDDPRSLIASDPLADAWGLVPHATVSQATFEQTVSHRDMLYLDKAWRELQLLTGPWRLEGTARPAFAMFEGEVAMRDLGWEAWVRPLFPEDLPGIERDLADLVRIEAEQITPSSATEDARDEVCMMHFLQRAHEFVAGLVADGRGMVYMIG